MAKEVRLKKSDIKKIHKYVRLLEKQEIKILRVILFGSYAKGKANPDSDIDIAVISAQFGQDKVEEMMSLRKIALKVDSHIEPIPLSPGDLKDHYSTLAQEIKKYGKDLKKLK